MIFKRGTKYNETKFFEVARDIAERYIENTPISARKKAEFIDLVMALDSEQRSTAALN